MVIIAPRTRSSGPRLEPRRLAVRERSRCTRGTAAPTSSTRRSTISTCSAPAAGAGHRRQQQLAGAEGNHRTAGQGHEEHGQREFEHVRAGVIAAARYSAGAIVDGLSESASPIETTRPTSAACADSSRCAGRIGTRPRASRLTGQAKCSSSPSRRRRDARRSGTTTGPRARVPHTACRGALAPSALRAPQPASSRRAPASSDRRRSARTRIAAVARSTDARRRARDARARAGAG